MRNTLQILLLGALVITFCAGCSSKSEDPTATTAAIGAPNSATLSAPQSTQSTPVADDTVLAQLRAGISPPCRMVVNEPASLVVTASSTGQIQLHCLTGASAQTDQTVAGSILCDPGDPKSTVYYWSSRDATAADQNVYAAKADGAVVVVATETAHGFTSSGSGLAAVVAAVGARC
jgi:glucose/arabinose dehydrogenase